MYKAKRTVSTTEKEAGAVANDDAVEPVIQKLGAFKFNSGMTLQNATQALSLSGPKPPINFKFNFQGNPNSGGSGNHSLSFNLPPKSTNEKEASGQQ